MAVVLLGTLDTKGAEYRFVRDLLQAQGVATLVVDAGVMNAPEFPADITREELYAAAGTTWDAVRKAADRGRAIEASARGAARIAVDLHAKGRLDGIVGLGGSAGTTIATAAMRALPFGVPKLMVSTLASGQVQHYVGVRDILMMHSVVDISGLNSISRTVLTNAANAMAGMVKIEGRRQKAESSMRQAVGSGRARYIARPRRSGVAQREPHSNLHIT
jgi:uncharacterized protein (UPF0261 family)